MNKNIEGFAGVLADETGERMKIYRLNFLSLVLGQWICYR